MDDDSVADFGICIATRHSDDAVPGLADHRLDVHCADRRVSRFAIVEVYCSQATGEVTASRRSNP
jgi:hypothetical protein